MIKKLLINSLVIFYVILSVNITAFSSAAEKQNDSKSDKGSILLRELLLAHRMLANSKQSDPDNSKIAKSIVLIPKLARNRAKFCNFVENKSANPRKQDVVILSIIFIALVVLAIYGLRAGKLNLFWVYSPPLAA